jgi:TolA-binding protein
MYGSKKDMKKIADLSSAAVVLVLLTQPLHAQETSRVQPEAANQAQTMTQAQSQDRIYGSSLMTQKERNEYQSQMRQMKTEQERANFRAQHHEQMKERAKAQGKALPDDMPANHGGQGMGQGQGKGMGQGQGKEMGQGGQSMGAGKGSGGGNKGK